MHSAVRASLLVLFALASTWAAAADKSRIVVPEGLQQSMLLCIGDAMRVCPSALTDKDHGLSCVLAKRRQLGRSCRAVYDEVARLRTR